MGLYRFNVSFPPLTQFPDPLLISFYIGNQFWFATTSFSKFKIHEVLIHVFKIQTDIKYAVWAGAG